MTKVLLLPLVPRGLNGLPKKPLFSPEFCNKILHHICMHWTLEQLWKSPHISIATKVKLFNTTCITILLYGCESWVISQDMENKINAVATSCYRVMLNIKRFDHVLNTTVYSMTNTVPLIHLFRHRQLKFLGHILRMSKEEPARRYTLYIPTIGKRRPGRPRTSYLNYVQRLLGDNEGAMQEQQIAHDRRAWRNLVVTCSAADGCWWWWWWSKTIILGKKCSTVSKWRPNNRFLFRVISILAKIWKNKTKNKKNTFPKEFSIKKLAQSRRTWIDLHYWNNI